jgi:hypothetical protein
MSQVQHYDVLIIGTGAGGEPSLMRWRPPANAFSCWNAATTCRARRITGARVR